MSNVSREVSFREVQRFRQPWLWALLAVVAVVSVVSGGPVAVVVAVGVGGFVWSLRLETEVRDDGLYLRFVLFHRSFRRVPWSEMGSFEAVTYRPLGEYGGWGIRWRPEKLAYNVSGSRGVRIERPDDRELLVGSQRPDDLARAMRNAARDAEVV
ncbi:hypothetical protein SAMN04487948_106141 [Halogranum amylolyticum]|uniref:PH domain-containing protein n=1 Tax=Halogranum amylolyticum TaxID=660520 RepID=A0A1H8TB93_9EURY|nr:hypothetical protein [Halogranum amylolyticum]SEO88085.1 hypothetical protein SAMN04487948_106141 [Halogranum amylolyticum]